MNIYFSERLLALRLQKMQNQETMAAIGGVGKRSQLHYEKGERMPDVSYLQNLEGHFRQLNSPVDLVYLITGRTTESVELLSVDERALIDAYRKAQTEGKKFIRQASGIAETIRTPMNESKESQDFELDIVRDYVGNKAKAKKKAKG